MTSGTVPGQGAGPEAGGQPPVELPAALESRPSRRGFVALAGVGVVGIAGSLGGGGLTRLEDIKASRARADGATLAERSTATSLKVLWRANTDRKVMALTFDDGPGPTLTSPLLDALAEAKVRVTFSLVGKRAFAHRDLVKRQISAGHELANHTWSHADLGQLDYAHQQVELERTDQLLYELSGKRPVMIRLSAYDLACSAVYDLTC